MNQNWKNLLWILVVLLVVTTTGIFREMHKKQEAALTHVETNGKPMMIEFGSDTCIPCKMMEEVLEELKEKFSNVIDIQFIHAKNSEILDEYNVHAIPTQIFFTKEGKEFFRHSGFFSVEEVVSTFEKEGIKMETNHE